MFSNDFKETKEAEMRIIDVPKKAFKMFLEYLYTGQFKTLRLMDALDLLKVADKYEVHKLKANCDKIIVDQIKIDHEVHTIFQLAHVYNCSAELKQKSFNLTTA